MNIKEKLEEARKCINQALIGLGKREKDDVFEIRIPNIRPDEVKAVRAALNEFAKQLLNHLQARRNAPK
jgi:hypothetical protein